MKDVMNSNLENDDIEAWCKLLNVSENHLYQMTEDEIHKMLDRSARRKRWPFKQPSLTSLYKYLNHKNHQIRKFFKNSKKSSIGDGESLDTVPSSHLSEGQTELGGGGFHRRQPDSKYLVKVLCDAANELEGTFGKDIFNSNGLNPCLCKNIMTELQIHSTAKDGGYFIMQILLDYENRLIHFQSKRSSEKKEIQTSKDIPLPDDYVFNKLEFDFLENGNAVVEIINYDSNDKKSKSLMPLKQKR